MQKIKIYLLIFIVETTYREHLILNTINRTSNWLFAGLKSDSTEYSVKFEYEKSTLEQKRRALK